MYILYSLLKKLWNWCKKNVAIKLIVNKLFNNFHFHWLPFNVAVNIFDIHMVVENPVRPTKFSDQDSAKFYTICKAWKVWFYDPDLQGVDVGTQCTYNEAANKLRWTQP